MMGAKKGRTYLQVYKNTRIYVDAQTGTFTAEGIYGSTDSLLSIQKIIDNAEVEQSSLPELTFIVRGYHDDFITRTVKPIERDNRAWGRYGYVDFRFADPVDHSEQGRILVCKGNQMEGDTPHVHYEYEILKPTPTNEGFIERINAKMEDKKNLKRDYDAAAADLDEQIEKMFQLMERYTLKDLNEMVKKNE